MSRRTSLALSLAMSLLGASACDEASLGDDDVALRPGYGCGGVLLNTSALGDWAVPQLSTNFGDSLDGLILEAIEIKSQDKSPVKLEKVWVDNGQIQGLANGVTYKGAQLEGSKWFILNKSVGVTRYMTLDKYELDANTKLEYYTFNYPDDPSYGLFFFTNYIFGGGGTKPDTKTEHNGTPLPVCAPDPVTNDIRTLVAGNFYIELSTAHVMKADNTITLNCVSGGTGKSYMWGYKPFEVGAEAWEAAIRVVRADYFGNNESWTKPGNALTLKDVWGVNTHPSPLGPTEAVWTPKGALCVGEPRDANFDYFDVELNGVNLPPCKDMILGDFGGEDLLWSAVP